MIYKNIETNVCYDDCGHESNTYILNTLKYLFPNATEKSIEKSVYDIKHNKMFLIQTPTKEVGVISIWYHWNMIEGMKQYKMKKDKEEKEWLDKVLYGSPTLKEK